MTVETITSSRARDEPASPVPRLSADPWLCTSQGRWWLYPTNDGFADWASQSFRAYSSNDLVIWTDHGEILRLGADVAWASERAWAPAMAEKDGRYYFYFTANHNIGVAVGDSPSGPFVEIGHPLIAAGDYAGMMIDPSIFIDNDGAAYLYWGNGTAHAVPLNDDMVSFDPAAVVSWTPLEFREAAHVHRHEGVYFLSWSENDTRSEDYRVRYATGPSPLGPWDHQGVILEKDLERGILGTGHHSIARVPGTDDWVIAFHRFRIPGGNGFTREVMFAPLEHTPQAQIKPVRFPFSPLRYPLGAEG